MRSWKSLNAWRRDGWPHERDERGVCRNCGAGPLEYHYSLKPRGGVR